MFGGVVMVIAFAIFLELMPVSRLTGVQVQIREQFDTLDDARAVIPVLAALNVKPDGWTVTPSPLDEILISALLRLLSKLTDREVVTLLGTRSQDLYRLMYWANQRGLSDLAIAILRLIPALADRPGLVATARLILRDAPTHAEQHVREKAREILPQLLERVDLGGVAALHGWINRLPTTVQDSTYQAQIEPQLTAHLALMQLLPRISPTDYLALPQKDRQRIYLNLHNVDLPRLKADYALVVLDLVRRSADVEALSTVYSLINGDAATPYPQVRQAARDCVPILKAQFEKEKVSKTLLRGASAPQGTGDTLLRPAAGAPTTDPQLLLRANVENSNL
jgi:hypothetical protein